MDKSSSNSTSFLYIIILAVIGLFVSGYLVSDHYDDSEHSFCEFNSHISCAKVKNSAYSEMFHVPVAVFGALWFVVLLLLALVGRSESVGAASRSTVNYYASAIFYWSLFGMMFVFYLVFAEFLLRTICPLCTIVHVVTIIVFGISMRMHGRQARRPAILEVAFALQRWAFVVAIFGVAIIVCFNYPVGPTSRLAEDSSAVTAQFAQCITQQGWYFFGLVGCSYCEKQKALFGEHFAHLRFVDCHKVDCSTRNLMGYPTWLLLDDSGMEISRWTGHASLKNIQAFTGCDLNGNASSVLNNADEPQPQQE